MFKKVGLLQKMNAVVSIQKPAQGCSILPVMLDPEHGSLYFLLAKERYHPTWPKGSHLWSDFGGGYQDTDECPEATASREFVEETLGQVKFFEADVLPREATEDITVALKQGHFLLQFVHEYNGHCFMTFVVQVPWDPLIPQRFHETRNLPEACTWDDCYLEKSHLGLFSVPQVQYAILNKGYLTSRITVNERCRTYVTQAFAAILPELQFHYPHLF